MEISRKVDAHYKVHRPPLDDVAQAFQSGLETNFQAVEVTVTDCPDLSSSPFNLAAPGLCGSERIADVGGPGNLYPHICKDKIFDLRTICETVGVPKAFAFGPGAGPCHKVGVCCEMMTNCVCGGHGSVNNRTFVAKVNPADNSYIQEPTPHGTTEFALMANLFISEGRPGQVIKVNAKTRTGPENFVTCLRKSLEAQFGQIPIGVGGVFIIKSGKAKLHVMPDFPEGGFPNKDYIGNNWLKFYEMSAPLVCLSVFHSTDPGYDLRVEHTHCFSDHGDAGHYHFDVTPAEVEYEGYFSLANEVFRIDQVPDA